MRRNEVSNPAQYAGAVLMVVLAVLVLVPAVLVIVALSLVAAGPMRVPTVVPGRLAVLVLAVLMGALLARTLALPAVVGCGVVLKRAAAVLWFRHGQAS
jgi:carbon starvation protein CstA